MNSHAIRSSTDWEALVEPVALALLRDPKRRTSTEWRYGRKGSLAVHVAGRPARDLVRLRGGGWRRRPSPSSSTSRVWTGPRPWHGCESGACWQGGLALVAGLALARARGSSSHRSAGAIREVSGTGADPRKSLYGPYRA